MIDHATSSDYAGYDAARAGVAVGPRGARGWLRVAGADAVSFLHGVLTNDIASLQVGQWCYAAYLTPQGRMVSDMRVLRRDGDLALETEPQVAAPLAARFDASIFTERVQIEPGGTWSSHSRGRGELTLGAAPSPWLCAAPLHVKRWPRSSAEMPPCGRFSRVSSWS